MSGKGFIDAMVNSASVAMAVYNGGRYLRSQIDSILEQLEDGDELVVSYDQSTDDTLAIVLEYAEADKRVRVLENQAPGIVGNFNNALRSCVNDVIFISDQDDLWLSGKREAMVDALSASGANLAIHNVVHIDGDDNVVSEPLFEKYGIGKGLLRNFAKPRYSGCCMAFPSETRRLILPMPESVVNYDHWIGMVCEACGEIVFVDDVFLKHRLHDANATTTRRPLQEVARQRGNLLFELIKRMRSL